MSSLLKKKLEAKFSLAHSMEVFVARHLLQVLKNINNKMLIVFANYSNFHDEICPLRNTSNN